MPETNSVSAGVAAMMRTLRTDRGWSAEQLAERVTARGIPWKRGTVTALETGVRATVSVDELLALTEVFGVSLLELLAREPDLPRFPREIIVRRDAASGYPRVAIDGEPLPWHVAAVSVNDIDPRKLATCTITFEAELVAQVNTLPLQSNETQMRSREAYLVGHLQIEDQ